MQWGILLYRRPTGDIAIRGSAAWSLWRLTDYLGFGMLVWTERGLVGSNHGEPRDQPRKPRDFEKLTNHWFSS